MNIAFRVKFFSHWKFWIQESRDIEIVYFTFRYSKFLLLPCSFYNFSIFCQVHCIFIQYYLMKIVTTSLVKTCYLWHFILSKFYIFIFLKSEPQILFRLKYWFQVSTDLLCIKLFCHLNLVIIAVESSFVKASGFLARVMFFECVENDIIQFFETIDIIKYKFFWEFMKERLSK